MSSLIVYRCNKCGIKFTDEQKEAVACPACDSFNVVDATRSVTKPTAVVSAPMVRDQMCHTTTIEYKGFANDANRDEVARILERYCWLIPRFIDRVLVICREPETEDNPNTSAHSVTYKANARGEIAIRGRFYQHSEYERHVTVVHEILHFWEGPFHQWLFENAVEPMKARNPELYEVVNDEARARNERYVEELAHVLVRQCGGLAVGH